MFIKRDSLLIRDAKIFDAAQLTAWWNDGKVMEHAGFPNGIGTSEEQVSRQITEQNDTKRRLIIEYMGKAIGEMCYTISDKNTACIGIKICEQEKQNMGLGSKLVFMLCDELFHRCHCEKIVLDTMLENKRAQHLYEKLGFVKTGIRENCFTDQLGRLRTAVDYELTPDRLSPISFDTSLIIRSANAGDLAQIEKLYMELFSAMANLQPEYCNAAAQDSKFILSVMAAAEQDILVAEQSDILGFALIMQQHTPPYSCFIQHPFTDLLDLVVSPEARGKGIGSSLLDAVKDWARANRSDYVELRALSNNTGAIRLYEREGFCECMKTFRSTL